MSQNKWLFLSVIAIMILAACEGDAHPPPEDFDWCYTYDFAAPDFVPADVGLNIESGFWLVGQGVSVDGTGELKANIVKDGAYVDDPRVVEVKLRRGVGVTGDVNIAAAADVFGIIVDINETVPYSIPGYPDGEIPYRRFIPGEENNETNISAINVTMQTSAQIILEYVEIAGWGASPFPENPCDDSATATATSTSTPEDTATYSPTPGTPTATLTPEPACTTQQDVSIPLTPEGPGSVTVVSATPPGWPNAVTLTAGNPLGTNYYVSPDLSSYNPWPGYNFTVRGAQISVGRTQTESSTVPGIEISLIDASTNVLADDLINMTAGSWGVHGGTGAGGGTARFQGASDLNQFSTPLADVAHLRFRFRYYAVGFFNTSGSKGMYLKNIVVRMCRETIIPPTATITNTPTHTYTPSHTHTRTPIGWEGGTLTATRTPSRTPIVLATWTPRPPNTALPSFTPLPTLIPTLPPPTLPATPTLITATPVTHTPEFSYTPLPTSVFTPFGTPGGTPYGTPVAWGTPWGSPVWTPIAQSTGLPEYEMTPQFGPVLGFLSTAAVQINSLPGSINQYVPNVDPGPLFGYVKWAASCVSAQELVGTTLSPIVCHAMLGLSLNIFLVSVLVIFRVVRLLIKFVTWIIQQVLKMIPMMG